MKTLITTLVLSIVAATSFAQLVPAAKQPANQPPAVNTAPPTGNTPPPAGATPPPSGATAPPAGATPPPAGATPPPAGATPPPAVNTPPPGAAVQPPVRNNQYIQPGLNQNNIRPGSQPGVNSPGSYNQGQMPTNGITPGQAYPPNSPVQPKVVQH